MVRIIAGLVAAGLFIVAALMGIAAYLAFKSHNELLAASGSLLLVYSLAAATGFAIIVLLDDVARSQDVKELIKEQRRCHEELCNIQRANTAALIAAVERSAGSAGAQSATPSAVVPAPLTPAPSNQPSAT